MQRAVPGRDDLLGTLRRLATEIEHGREEQVSRLLDDLTRIRETELFCEMGRLTRQLHDALGSVRFDTELSSLTEHAIPHAKARLDYVLARTEQAAHRTLSAVEESAPLAERLGEQARALGERWQRLQRGELPAEESRALGGELASFLAALPEDTDLICARLRDVLMAQDFQDLTGQVIRRVIDLVQQVEDNLVGLIRTRRHNGGDGPARSAQAGSAGGPAVGSRARGERVSGQDEVDELLSSLGF